MLIIIHYLLSLGSRSGPYVQYSYDVANSVTTNMTILFDTNLGTYTNLTVGYEKKYLLMSIFFRI
jgi:hypothetical protein